MLFKFDIIDNAIGKLKENQEGLELRGTRHILDYANDVSSLDENRNAIRKDTEALRP
jgi:hypothetical protein